MDFSKLEGKDGLERLDIWRQSRIEEEERVEAAYAKPESERTQADRNAIAYSKFGTASKH